MIGAGALGSAVCESFVRSGLVDLSIIDKDVLAPHNLARHTLSQQDIGRFKATALADRFNVLFLDGSIAQGIAQSVQDLSVDEIKRLFLGSDFIVDCSASIAVQRWLADLPVTRPSVVCAFQVCAGSGTLILAESSQTDSRVFVDAIEAALLANRKKHPIIEEWLDEHVEPVQVGG